MTRYAIDEERTALVAVWATGGGDLASTVAHLPVGCAPQDGLPVAFTLSALAEALWRTYTHPASAADSMQDNSEGWRRQQERDAFAMVLDALRKPELPEPGMLTESLVVVTESAHRVGRALHAVGDAPLTEAVVREVQGELAAIEQAELGDLSGRARQAVVLSREDVSPLQVGAADALLREDPFGNEQLFTEVDPSAAAVAAAHWLQAAADVAARVADADPVDVVARADDIEALPHETATVVLGLMSQGVSAREAVTALIRDALLVAEGLVPDAGGLVQLVEDALVQSEQFRGEEGLAEALLAGIRATPLDPMRPALDLLEDLLAGIRGCWLLYQQYADADESSFRSEEDVDEAAGDEDGEADPAEFLDLMRAEAAAHGERLA